MKKPQLFPRYADPLLRSFLLAGSLLVVLLPTALYALVRSPYFTQQEDPVLEPLEFDHRHHVRDDAIDCVYCHSGALRDAYAGVPSATVCMRCHNQIWNDSAYLAPIRLSAERGEPIVWRRITNLPQHVFFHHGAHTSRGVGCVVCHGRVDEMASMYAARTMTMSWCIECHRDPASRIERPDHVTDLGYVPSDIERQATFASENLAPSTSCSTCHR
jgi:hypothetical protein